MIVPTLLFLAFSFLPLRDVIPALGPAGVMSTLAGLSMVLAAPRVFSGVAALRGNDSILLLCLWATITMSQPMQGWFGGALPSFLAFSVPAIMFYLLVVALDGIKAFGKVAAVVVVTSLAICSLALSEYYGLVEPSPVHTEDEEPDEEQGGKFVLTQSVGEDSAGDPIVLRRIRGSGVLEDPNDLAQFLLVVSPLLLVAWQPRRPVRNLFVVVIPAVILAHSIYLTHSRGALIGIAGIAVAWLHRWIGFKGLIVAAVLVLLLLAGGFGGSRSMSADEGSAQGRIVAWSEGLQMLKQSPVFGVGFHNFTDYHELTAHNSFVLCFAELGLVGYFFWLGLIVHGFLSLRQVAASQDSATARWAGALTLSFIGYLATALFLSRTYAAVLYVVLAMITALRHLQFPPQELRSPRNWLAITAAGVCLSPVCTYLVVRLTQITGNHGF